MDNAIAQISEEGGIDGVDFFEMASSPGVADVCRCARTGCTPWMAVLWGASAKVALRQLLTGAREQLAAGRDAVEI